MSSLDIGQLYTFVQCPDLTPLPRLDTFTLQKLSSILMGEILVSAVSHAVAIDALLLYDTASYGFSDQYKFIL